MRFYLMLPIAFLALLVMQDLLADILFLGRSPCELSLILAIYSGFRMPYVRGAIVVSLLGFMMDCVSSMVTGWYMFVYLFIFICSRIVSRRLYSESDVFIGAVVFICGAGEVLLCLLFKGFVYGNFSLSLLYPLALPQLVILTVIGPFFFHIGDRVGLYRGYDARLFERP